jgi:uroporphyrin-III C-methyltransferase/precorrin-2 dehydrogenase/sirohydrochlorin ferrochelatase
MPFRYPVALELAGRRCVVIGGGTIAEHKARALIEAEADVTVVAEHFTQGLQELAYDGELRLQARSYAPGDLAGAWLAIAATDDGSVNAAVFEEAEERHVLLNSVDDIEHCHFSVPSIVRRGELMFAISTGGKAPALAKRLRRELADRFGAEYGALVDLLGDVREEQLDRRRVDFDTWAARWQKALDHDLLGLVRAGRIAEARALVGDLLEHGRTPPVDTVDGRSSAHDAPMPRGTPAGKVYIVGAGPGDPGLLPVRAQEVLERADVVVYDRLVDPCLVRNKRAVFVGKQAGRHHVTQEQTNALLVNLARANNHVVRLKGGDPFVFGRGAEEAVALAAAGVAFEVIPAPTAGIAALAYAGIPVTHRDHGSSVAFVTGQSALEGSVDWNCLATAVDTIVVYMALGNISSIAEALIAGGRSPRTPSAVVENGTLPFQRVISAPLTDLPSAVAQAAVESPAIVVIGDVVSVRDQIRWFEDSAAPRLEQALR